jgi:hypothetical protein
MQNRSAAHYTSTINMRVTISNDYEIGKGILMKKVDKSTQSFGKYSEQHDQGLNCMHPERRPQQLLSNV